MSSRMARTKIMFHQGKRGGETTILQIRVATKAETRERKPLSLVHPLLQLETLCKLRRLCNELQMQSNLRGVGRSPLSLLTQQLAQMAAEAGPSMSGKEETARRKLQMTMRGKVPPEGIPPSWKSEEDQEVLAWHSCSLRDLAVPKEHRAPYLETPLLRVSPWHSPWSGQI